MYDNRKVSLVPDAAQSVTRNARFSQENGQDGSSHKVQKCLTSSGVGLRKGGPCHDVKPPERGSRKAKQYLYPSEFLTFVSCPDVPLRWRRAVALAVYLFPRDGELRELRWDAGDVDLERGVLAVTRALNARTGKAESTKSGETRRFAVESNVLPLLRAMRGETKGKGAVVAWHEPHMSRGLRR